MTHATGTSTLRLVLAAALLCGGALPAHAAARNEVKRIVVEEAVLNGRVPPSLALAVARMESNFDPRAKSHAGARGLMQIMPRTARTEFGVEADELWEPRLNARLGIRYLERLHRQYGERWDLALSHYNGGSLARNRWGQYRAHGYTRGYVDRVLRQSRRYERDASVVALVRHSEPAASDDRRAQVPSENLAYWMYEEPGVDRGWRDYLQAADHWLERSDRSPANERTKESTAPSNPAPVDPASVAPAYWEVIGEEKRDSGDAQSPSQALEKRISDTRRRFREQLVAGGDAEPI